MSALAALTQLIELSIDINELSDVSALAALTRLEKLDLAYNYYIVSLPELATLQHLKTLNLSGNNIADVAPLARLTHLKNLDLHGNRILNVAPLATLTQLETLDLRENYGYDVSSGRDIAIHPRDSHILAIQARGTEVIL